MHARALLLCLSLLLAACASPPPLPSSTPELALPLQLHVQREQDGQRQDWLLVIQQEGDALRWSLLDPLGMPLARQLLVGQAWHSDGLLPPNPQARELFAALLFALVDDEQLAELWPDQHWQVDGDMRRLDPRWQVYYRASQDFDLRVVGGPLYRISPLTAEPSP
jgi:hypothetical protein